jgi:hypothetical protein
VREKPGGKICPGTQVESLSGIKLKYPKDFRDSSLVIRLLANYGLALSAVNVDAKDVTYSR